MRRELAPEQRGGAVMAELVGVKPADEFKFKVDAQARPARATPPAGKSPGAPIRSGKLKMAEAFPLRLDDHSSRLLRRKL